MELNIKTEGIPFDLGHTLECGQVFRWEKYRDWWYSVSGEQAFKVRQTEGKIEFKGIDYQYFNQYFRLEDDLQEITKVIAHDSFIAQAIKAFYGLRLVRQNPWECLISFICATWKGVKAIDDMLARLARKFGRKILFDGLAFYTFPQPDVLAHASLRDLRSCGLGFRAPRVRETARRINNGILDLIQLKKGEYEEGRDELLQLPGVGRKVADCILLFSLEKLEAFPIDVWMKRTVQTRYLHWFDQLFINKLVKKESLSSTQYERISASARRYFGEYAGYAQEYLYHYVRKGNLLDPAA
jgi:N-glycosylase/DNA lyase